MVEAVLWSYPLLLFCIIVIAHLGRGRSPAALEWARLLALAAAFGVLLAFQTGSATQAQGAVVRTSGTLTIFATAGLIAICLYERWTVLSAGARAAPTPAS